MQVSLSLLKGIRGGFTHFMQKWKNASLTVKKFNYFRQEWNIVIGRKKILASILFNIKVPPSCYDNRDFPEWLLISVQLN